MHFWWRQFGWEELPLKRVRFDLAAECLDCINEFVNFIETLMDGCVTQIRDLIDRAQLLQNLRPDGRRRNFAPTGF